MMRTKKKKKKVCVNSLSDRSLNHLEALVLSSWNSTSPAPAPAVPLVGTRTRLLPAHNREIQLPP